MKLDIDLLNEDFQTKVDLIEEMEEDIDILDARSRTDTMRIFGLEEIEHDSYTELRKNIVDNVLKIACPEENWEPDDITRAYRAGEAINGKPRMVIMKLRHNHYKHILYTQYIKKRNTYIFVDNLSNFKDVHFKLAGYID